MTDMQFQIDLGGPVTVGVPAETLPGETRVALCPDDVRRLAGAGLGIGLESGAGERAGYADADYGRAGARILGDRAELFGEVDVLVQVNTYPANPATGAADLPALRDGQIVIGLADPLSGVRRVAELSRRRVVGFGLELMPRITRAQSMDVLSSMGMVSGYRAAVIAAARLPRCFPMSMTAAGTVHAARVLVIGAGVAGLQAIATSKRLGANVRAYDIRPAAREQVESVGGTFLELPLETEATEDAGGYAREQADDFLDRQRALLSEAVAASDVVITTAAIPGRKAPILVTEEMLRQMPRGSVVVDLAAPRGGNCDCTRPGAEADVGGVVVLGPTNLPAEIPYHASSLYSRNVSSFLRHLVAGDRLLIDDRDEIVRSTLMCRGGEVVHSRLRDLITEEPATC